MNFFMGFSLDIRRRYAYKNQRTAEVVELVDTLP